MTYFSFETVLRNACRSDVEEELKLVCVIIVDDLNLSNDSVTLIVSEY